METSDYVELFKHTDSQRWNRLKTAAAVEVGVLAGIYYLRGIAGSVLISAITIAGLISLTLILFLIQRDTQFLEAFGAKFLDAKGKRIDWGVPLPQWGIKGKSIAILLMFLLMVFDVFFAIIIAGTKLDRGDPDSTIIINQPIIIMEFNEVHRRPV